MSFETITYETRGTAAIVTMNRPDKLNAWVPHMSTELVAAFARANDEDDVSSIILTGAGRGFCAGADMDATFGTRLGGTDPGGTTAQGWGGLPAGINWPAVCRTSKPLIAAVNGAAVGIGATQILPFDVIVASTKAKFGFLFVRVGLVPELASSHYLVSRVGLGRASELMLSGRIFPAEEAQAIGMVDYLVEPDALMDKALEIAESFAGNPVPMMRMIKDLIAENACARDTDAVQDLETKYLRRCWEMAEHREAVDAFVQKRKPDFKKARNTE